MIENRNTMQGIPTQEAESIPTLGWLGPNGTFTELAALQLQKDPKYSEARLVEFKSITAASEAAANGSVSYAIIPIENSIGGHVKDTVEALTALGLQISGELVLPITQTFYAQDQNEVRIIASKDQGILQSGKWIKENYPNAEIKYTDSTAAAVVLASQDATIGAIAAPNAALALGLTDVLKVTISSVQDNPFNATRFLVVNAPKSELPPITGKDKTSLIMRLSDAPGSLYSCLDALASNNINITQIKSFSRTNGIVSFLVTIQGHQNEPHVKSSLHKITTLSSGIKLLGSYPEADFKPEEMTENPPLEKAIDKVKEEISKDKTVKDDDAIIVFTLQDKKGALRDALSVFARKGINLTTIDSFPTGRILQRQLGEYAFYLAFSNHTQGRDEIIREMSEKCLDIIMINKIKGLDYFSN